MLKATLVGLFVPFFSFGITVLYIFLDQRADRRKKLGDEFLRKLES